MLAAISKRANGMIFIFMKIGCLMSLFNEFIDNSLCSFQFHQNILKYTVSNRNQFLLTRAQLPCPLNFNPADHYVHVMAVSPGKEAESRQRVKRVRNMLYTKMRCYFVLENLHIWVFIRFVIHLKLAHMGKKFIKSLADN